MITPQRPQRFVVTGPHQVHGRPRGEEVWLADTDQIRRLRHAGHIAPAGHPPAATSRTSPGQVIDTQTATRPHENTKE